MLFRSQQDWFAHLPMCDDFPELTLREVTDLPAAMAAVPTQDDPVELLAIPA